MRFHDGTAFDADAVIWNLDRYFKSDSPQYEPPAAGISRARAPLLAGYRKIDDRTVAITSRDPVAYFPYMVVYLLFTSPASFEAAGRDWARVATLPAAGTGPFRITPGAAAGDGRTRPQPGLLGRRAPGAGRPGAADADPGGQCPHRRPAAGQVDWIEAPPPDAIPSLRQAGFAVTTGSYPHIWPWLFNIGAAGSPLRDVRVRRALNYCIDRDGLVTFLNGTAEPAVGWLKPDDPEFGAPQNRYRLDPAKGRALLAEAGFGAERPLKLTLMLSASGSGQMQPLPMNEFLQETLKQNCGVDVALEVVEWQVLLNAMRATPDAPSLRGATVLNISSTTSDVAVMARYFGSANLAPKGFNFAQWADARFDAAMMDAARASTPEAMDAAMRAGHERLVDDPPWLYVVHDLNPRAMSPRVKGFVPPRSWFVDLTRISVP